MTANLCTYVTTLSLRNRPIAAWLDERLCLQYSHMRFNLLSSGLINLLTNTWRSLEHAVMPATCVFCGARHGLRKAPICEACYLDLPWIERACPRCANPVVAELPANVCCVACQLQPLIFSAAVAPLRYAFPIDAAIKAMKFNRRLFYAPAFAHILNDALAALPADIDALLPVPLHWRRQAFRGFNQAVEICRPVSKRNGLALIRTVRRRRATPFQSGLAAAQRRHNLDAAFAVRGALSSRHIVIVDDVITTGATCSQLAKVLLDAGAEKISVLALARASPD